MTSNPEPIVQQLQHEFQNLLAYVTGPEARSQTAYTVELTLFRRLLGLGAALLRLFLVTRAAVRPAEPATAPDGTRLTYHDQRRRSTIRSLAKWASRGMTSSPPSRSGSARSTPSRARRPAAIPTCCGSGRSMGRPTNRPREPDGAGKPSWGSRSACTPWRPVSPRRQRMWPASMRSQQSRPPHRPSARFWWCRPMAQGCRWCSRPPRGRLCAWAKGRSAARRRKRSSPGSTRVPPLHAPPRRWWPPCCRTPAARSRRPAHSRSTKNCGPPWRGKRSPCPAGAAGRAARGAPDRAAGGAHRWR